MPPGEYSYLFFFATSVPPAAVVSHASTPHQTSQCQNDGGAGTGTIPEVQLGVAVSPFNGLEMASLLPYPHHISQPYAGGLSEMTWQGTAHILVRFSL